MPHSLGNKRADMCGSLFQKWFWNVATCAATSACVAILLGSLAPSCAARLPVMAAPPSPRKKHTHPSCVSNTSTRPELSAERVAHAPHTSVCPTALKLRVFLSPHLSQRPRTHQNKSAAHPATLVGTPATLVGTPKPSLSTQPTRRAPQLSEDGWCPPGVKGSAPRFVTDHHGWCLP